MQVFFESLIDTTNTQITINNKTTIEDIYNEIVADTNQQLYLYICRNQPFGCTYTLTITPC